MRKITGDEDWVPKVEQALALEGSLEDRIRTALERFLQELQVERGCLLLERAGENPELLHCGPPHLAERFPFSRAVVDRVLDEGKGIYSFDSSEDERVQSSKSLVGVGARSFACVPLRENGEFLGVVYIDNPIAQGVFTEGGLNSLERFSRRIVQHLVS